jgi:hypothetical protein
VTGYNRLSPGTARVVSVGQHGADFGNGLPTSFGSLDGLNRPSLGDWRPAPPAWGPDPVCGQFGRQVTGCFVQSLLVVETDPVQDLVLGVREAREASAVAPAGVVGVAALSAER